MECVVIILMLFGTVLSLPVLQKANEEATCGYASCPVPKDGMLNVHLIAHSHDDVGWLGTVDEYYYGEETSGVQYIIDSTTSELLKDKSKRFIQVETAYFWKWWLEQNEEMRENYRTLVNTGQIQMTGGGWSMNDEGTSHYLSLIDQFTLGLRKLNDTFGDCGRPRVGWQIDPFGHSKESASIMAQIGFDGVLLARLDFQDKNNRMNEKTMEMVWHTSSNLGPSSDIFTSALYNEYAAPPGLCFDITCKDDPVIDNTDSPDYNAYQKFLKFRDFVTEQSTRYATDNIIVTMGEDFQYSCAHYNFKNLDKLIKIVNSQQNNGSNINVFYSTPACYIKSLNDKNLTWPTKNDDFFPYASDAHAFWTGYFTSRPTSKRYERHASGFLQVCKQLSVLANLSGIEYQKQIDKLREAVGIMQHHDAITGTEKQHVANDYARLLTLGIKSCENIIKTSLNKLMSDDEQSPLSLSHSTCHLLNISQCDVSERFATFLVTVYNPNNHPVSHYIRLPVTGDRYKVTDNTGIEVPSQLVPVPESVINIPERTSKATNELVFQVENVPGFGFSVYTVTLSSDSEKFKISEDSNDTTIGNDDLTVNLDPTTGLIKTINNNRVEIPLEHNFHYYTGIIGDNSQTDKRSSGAYIFRPNGTDTERVAENARTKVYKGDIVEEIHQVFSEWVSQVIRVYKNEQHIELEWMVGPIPVDDGNGKELISKFKTDLDTEETFYTDSNGRELIKRKLNYRPTWNLTLEEPISGNYYPVTTRILIRDEQKGVEVAVLNDRAQGGSSLSNGQLELMVHRRLLHDDAKGVAEALNETEFDHGLITRGRHYIVAGNVSGNDNLTLAAKERLLAQKILWSPWIFLSPSQTTDIKQQFSGIKNTLQKNIQILTLEYIDDRSLLLRLENILEKTDDPVLSVDVTVNLQDILSFVTITSVKETTLAANQWLSDLQKLSWRNVDSNNNPIAHEQDDGFSITLSPMQIRTFIVYF